MNEASHDEPSPVMAAQQQLESRMIPSMSDDSSSKWKILLRVALIMLVLAGVGFAAYKMTIGKAVTVAPKPVNKIKTFTVADVWPSMTGVFASSTGEATSSSAYIVITVNDFNTTYSQITNNETNISEIASKYFNVSELSSFTTQPINNINLRVADGGDRLVVYGFVGEKYLVFTTSIADWFKIYEKLIGTDANKSS